ncbi:MAG: hypothetical protein IJ092_07955 [Atopobiaceae bacterium]|nr:hypothetical protein [Atopobiaceae bacterium]
MVGVDWDFLKDGAGTLDDVLASLAFDERGAGLWAADRIAASGLTRGEVIRRSRLNQTFAYQILSGARRASRDKLIQLAFGMELGIEGCCELLERGGANALSSRHRRDVAIAYCLDRKIDLAACDDLLWGLGEPTLVPEGQTRPRR